MKKIIFILIFILVNNCNGYQPVFSSKGSNFYVNEISIKDGDKISQKLKKKFKPYELSENSKKEINLRINSSKISRSIAKNSKGDDTTFEMVINSNIKITLKDSDDLDINFQEKFVYNNQTNKFELEQYKKTIEDDLITKIFEKLIIKLRSL